MSRFSTAGWFGGVVINFVEDGTRKIIEKWSGPPPRKHDHVELRIDDKRTIYKVMRVMWRSEPKEGKYITIVDVMVKEEQ